MASEVNFHFLLLAKLFAEPFHSRNYAQIVQFGRVQLVRHRLDIDRYLCALLSYCVYAGAEFRNRIGEILLDSFEFDCQKCESLGNVVVQVSRDPGTFLLLCFNQLSAHA